MKKVEIMKAAINDMKKSGMIPEGNIWKANRNGLVWNYCDLVFELEEIDDVIMFTEPQAGVSAGVLVVTDPEMLWIVDGNHDCALSKEDALYWATRHIIRKAQNVY